MLKLKEVGIDEYYQDLFGVHATTRVLFTSKSKIFEGRSKAYVIPGLECEHLVSFIERYKDHEVFIRYGAYRELANKVRSIVCLVVDLDPVDKEREVTVEQLSDFCEVLESELNLLPKYVVKSGKGWHLVFPIPKSTRYGRYFAVNCAKGKQAKTFLRVIEEVVKKHPSVLDNVKIDSAVSTSSFRAPGTKGKYGNIVTPYRVLDYNWRHERGLIALLTSIQFHMVWKVFTIGRAYRYEENIIKRGYDRIHFPTGRKYGELSPEEYRAITRGMADAGRVVGDAGEEREPVRRREDGGVVLSPEEKAELFEDIISALEATPPGMRNTSFFWLMVLARNFVPVFELKERIHDFHRAISQEDHPFPLVEVKDALKSIERRNYKIPSNIESRLISKAAAKVIEKWLNSHNVFSGSVFRAKPGIGRVRIQGVVNVARILYDFPNIRRMGNKPFYRFMEKYETIVGRNSLPLELEDLIEAFMSKYDRVREIFQNTHPPFGKTAFELKRLRRYYRRCLPNGRSTREYLVFGREPLETIRKRIRELLKKLNAKDIARRKMLVRGEGEIHGSDIIRTGGGPTFSLDGEMGGGGVVVGKSGSYSGIESLNPESKSLKSKSHKSVDGENESRKNESTNGCRTNRWRTDPECSDFQSNNDFQSIDAITDDVDAITDDVINDVDVDIEVHGDVQRIERKQRVEQDDKGKEDKGGRFRFNRGNSQRGYKNNRVVLDDELNPESSSSNQSCGSSCSRSSCFRSSGSPDGLDCDDLDFDSKSCGSSCSKRHRYSSKSNQTKSNQTKCGLGLRSSGSRSADVGTTSDCGLSNQTIESECLQTDLKPFKIPDEILQEFLEGLMKGDTTEESTDDRTTETPPNELDEFLEDVRKVCCRFLEHNFSTWSFLNRHVSGLKFEYCFENLEYEVWRELKPFFKGIRNGWIKRLKSSFGSLTDWFEDLFVSSIVRFIEYHGFPVSRSFLESLPDILKNSREPVDYGCRGFSSVFEAVSYYFAFVVLLEVLVRNAHGGFVDKPGDEELVEVPRIQLSLFEEENFYDHLEAKCRRFCFDLLEKTFWEVTTFIVENCKPFTVDMIAGKFIFDLSRRLYDTGLKVFPPNVDLRGKEIRDYCTESFPRMGLEFDDSELHRRAFRSLMEGLEFYFERQEFLGEYTVGRPFRISHLADDGTYALMKLRLSHYRVSEDDGKTKAVLIFRALPVRFWEGPWKPVKLELEKATECEVQSESGSENRPEPQSGSQSEAQASNGSEPSHGETRPEETRPDGTRTEGNRIKDERFNYLRAMIEYDLACSYRAWASKKREFLEDPSSGVTLVVTFEVDREFNRYPTLRLDEAGNIAMNGNPHFLRMKLKYEDLPSKIMPFVFIPGREFYVLCDVSQEEIEVLGFLKLSQGIRRKLFFEKESFFEDLSATLEVYSDERFFLNNWMPLDYSLLSRYYSECY